LQGVKSGLLTPSIIWKEERVKERIEVFLEQYRPALPEYIRKLEQQAIADEVPVIRRGTRDMLRYLLHTKRPHRVLEVGTAIGYSALVMKECLPETSRIVTIEKVEMRLREARKNLAAYDTGKRIILLEGDAVEVLPELVEKKEKFDFIFMDAAKGQYLNFLPAVLQLMNEGATLVTDNIFHEGDVLQSRYAVARRDRTIHGRMREYLRVLSNHECLETICLPIGDGMTVSTWSAADNR
jgi:predicted O-methyltransferase YrrM